MQTIDLIALIVGLTKLLRNLRLKRKSMMRLRVSNILLYAKIKLTWSLHLLLILRICSRTQDIVKQIIIRNSFLVLFDSLLLLSFDILFWYDAQRFFVNPKVTLFDWWILIKILYRNCLNSFDLPFHNGLHVLILHFCYY